MNNALYIYKRGTRLARIARELGIPVQYQQDGGLWTVVKRRKRLRWGINWGCLRKLPVPAGTTVLNSNAINAAKKVRAFQLFGTNDVPCPEWSKSYDELNKKISESRTIFARRDGLSGGKGIQLVSPQDRKSLDPRGNNFDFYTARIPYEREFRIHVWGKEVLISQVKLLTENSNSPIHNWENGTVFSEESFDKFVNKKQTEELHQLAHQAIDALGLFFGAVDIIRNPKGKLYVLEVNTAPGIRSDPVESAYKRALKELLV